MIVSLFVTQDFGLMLQDSYEKSANFDNMIGLKVPYFYFARAVSRRFKPFFQYCARSIGVDVLFTTNHLLLMRRLQWLRAHVIDANCFP